MPTLHSLHAKLDRALNQFKAQDLGYKYDDSPCSYDPKKTQYPGLWLPRLDSDMDLPEEGKAVVEYRVTSRSMDEREGKKKYSMNLEIRSFDPQGTKKSDEKKLKEGKAVEMSSRFTVRGSRFEFSDRTRNGDGQFVANVTGGADPVTMRQAYGDKPQRSKLLAPGAVAATLAGAGLVGTKPGRVMAARGVKGTARMLRSGLAAVDRKMSGKTGEMWPRMGSRSKPKQREGLGEVIIRQSAKAKTGPKWPRQGD